MKIYKTLSAIGILSSTFFLPMQSVEAKPLELPKVVKETLSARETRYIFGVPGPKITRETRNSKGYSYVVRGRRYYVMSREKALKYSVVGIASHYGGKFNGRKTATGEIYDDRLYTAASKTLPIPSYAVVTNLSNGRQVIVRINDRGPYIGNRKIDLSSAAARQLGMYHKGVSRVRIESFEVSKNGKIIGAGSKTLLKLAQKQYKQRHK